MRLIDADQVEERLMILQANCERKPSQLTSAIWSALEAVRDFVREQPTIEPVKRGKWLVTTAFDQWERFKGYEMCCSHCHNCYMAMSFSTIEERYKYCPHCGAKMDGDD